MVPVLDSRLVSPDTLIPLVRQRVSGPLDSIIRQAIIRAAIDFCKRSALIHLERQFDEVLEGQAVSFDQRAAQRRQVYSAFAIGWFASLVLAIVVGLLDTGSSFLVKKLIEL